MRKKNSNCIHILVIILLCLVAGNAAAQVIDPNFDDGFTVNDNTFNPNAALDSLKASHKDIPKGIRVWTIDERFGDIVPAV
ncbi:MAG: hypothetical protein J6S52_05020, partial [Prevotella sp.]|nr:hypothetical protein [Prevotella sp.]